MIHHVVIEKLCECALSYKIEQIRSYPTKEEALQEAHIWAEELSNSFCGKHAFDIVQVNNDFVISVERGGYSESCEV